MKSTRLASHHAISASRANPESARRMMRVCAQRSRICATIRAISSTEPAEASMLAQPQLRRQQVTAAEHVQRQIAVAVVIAVEEPPFLMPVQRIVGGVEIKNDLPRRPSCAPPGTASRAASQWPQGRARSCDSASPDPGSAQAD